jgi:ribose transport system ATP-binding protein
MDVGAKEEVMSIVESLREQGVATILFSTEPELIIAHADRVIILMRGAEVAELKNEDLSKNYCFSTPDPHLY